MVRTAQTAGLSERDIYHVQSFVDHAGKPATRVRHSSRKNPIPTDFHAQPVFTFQIYTTFSLDLAERPTKRAFNAFDAERTVLTDLIDYVGSLVAGDAQRPEPLWELYTEQQGALECVEHQRREIAHRKARREDTSVPPIPKVERDWTIDSGKTGFIIVVDSDSFKVGENGSPGPLWVHFDRIFPSKISWEPRLRLDADPDNPYDDPEDDDSDIPDDDVFWSSHAPKILPERADATFLRIQLVNEMRYDLAMNYFFSCAPSDPPSSVQDTMDICWSDDEGVPDDERAYTEDIITTLQHAAARLSLDDYNIQKPAETEIIISNVAGILEPDLRYVIYVPFLHQSGLGNKLEQVATAFTHEITSRLSGKKTVSFVFCKPPSNTLSSALAAYRARSKPEDYVGALTTFPNESDDIDKDYSVFVRAHPISRSEHALENDPAQVEFEPYRTFLVVLDRPDFGHIQGGVLFLLADGGKSKPDSNADQNMPWEVEKENQNYSEMKLWRSAGMDEVARRLQMVWGGVKWEQEEKDQTKIEQ